MLPPPAHHVVIRADYGGQLMDYSARVSAYMKRRVTVRIEGECASSCTLVTALPAERICVAPGAKLEFHQAYLPNRFNPLDTTIRSEDGTAVMMSHYPPALRGWIADHGGLGPDLIELSGAELQGIIRVCPRQDRRR